MQLLELYVSDQRSGETQMQAVQLPADSFSPGGRLTLGQAWSAERPLQHALTGQYRGLLDEVRLWTRPHNPRLVARYQWQPVQDSSPDLLGWWPLNEGSGADAHDAMPAAQHLRAVSAFNAPHWLPSELVLDREQLAPRLQAANSSHLRQAAHDWCSGQLAAGSTLGSSCATALGGAAHMQAAYMEPCVASVLQTGDMSSAVRGALLQLAAQCARALSLSSSPAGPLCNAFPQQPNLVPRWYGASCAQQCVLGINNAVGGSCSCMPGYWDSQCASLCPISARSGGVCNDHGLCSATRGNCTCESRWEGGSAGGAYPCDVCTGGWHGADCNTAVLDPSVPRAAGTAMVLADVVASVDGAFFRSASPGVYTAFNCSSGSVRLLASPCDTDLNCRRVTEVTLQQGTSLVSAQLSSSSSVGGGSAGSSQLQLFHSTDAGNSWTALSLPSHTQHGSVHVSWIIPGACSPQRSGQRQSRRREAAVAQGGRLPGRRPGLWRQPGRTAAA